MIIWSEFCMRQKRDDDHRKTHPTSMAFGLILETRGEKLLDFIPERYKID